MSQRTTEERSMHTPGPWYVNPAYPLLVNAVGKSLSFVYAPAVDCPLLEMAKADARLIAAAPDLLALAKKYASECAWCSGTGTIEHVPFDNGVSSTSKCIQCADIRAVIAKAEGSE